CTRRRWKALPSATKTGRFAGCCAARACRCRFRACIAFDISRRAVIAAVRQTRASEPGCALCSLVAVIRRNTSPDNDIQVLKMLFCIFSFNRGRFLQNCVDSIEQCAPGARIVVFDDSSYDEATKEVLEQLR